MFRKGKVPLHMLAMRCSQEVHIGLSHRELEIGYGPRRQAKMRKSFWKSLSCGWNMKVGEWSKSPSLGEPQHFRSKGGEVEEHTDAKPGKKWRNPWQALPPRGQVGRD